jgi:hypothetical protein
VIDPQMFVLVNAADERQIFAFGIDTGEEAITFRRDPVTERTEFGVHTDADSAFRLNSRITRGHFDLKLVRFEFSEPVDDEFVDELPTAELSPAPEQ